MGVGQKRCAESEHGDDAERFEVLTTMDQIKNIATEWRELEDVSCSNGVFQTPAWCLAWMDVYGASGAPMLFATFRHKQLITVFPLWNHSGHVAFLGTPFNDRNAIPSIENPVGLLVYCVSATASVARSLHLTALDQSIARTVAVAASDLSREYRLSWSQETTADIRLPTTWETYQGSLVLKHRHRGEYLCRRIANNPNFSIDCVTDPADVAQALEWFIECRRRNLAIRSFRRDMMAVLLDAKFDHFLRSACVGLAHSGRLWLPLIVRNGEYVAGSLLFRSGSRVLKYMATWEPQLAPLSLGTVLDMHSIRMAIDYGASVFDLGRGAESYKRRLGANVSILPGVEIMLE